MQISRLFEIVYLLLEKKSTTAKELADRFEVSVRTIYRDIDSLCEAGIPIFTSQGKGGGIALVDEYVLNKSLLSQSEQDEILYALKSLAAAKGSQGDQVLGKLTTLFNKQATDWIEVDCSPWGSGQDGRSQFEAIKRAILGRKVLEFDYVNARGEHNRRQAEPQKLLFKVSAWYLRGYCRQRRGVRTFRVSRMANLSVLEETFERRTPGEAADAADRSQPLTDVRLKISPKAAHRVYDDFRTEEIERLPDGSFAVTTALPAADWLIGYLLSFGGALEVLSPPDLRAALRKSAREILNNHPNQEP